LIDRLSESGAFTQAALLCKLGYKHSAPNSAPETLNGA